MIVEGEQSRWSLEVVRGKDPGRVFALTSPSILLGNAIDPSSGINLSSQEADALRRMSNPHARLDVSGETLAIVDLKSAGGTFVNRERLTPNLARPLADEDLLQLGSIQLRVRLASTPASKTQAPTRHTEVGFSFRFPSGALCRSWDDFLVVSSQKWDELRDELTTGRLSSFLIGIGRKDLVPDAMDRRSADDRLDAWIERLPTSRPSNPELEVSPRQLEIRVAAGGGTTRRKVTILNVGYRVLRSSLRVEPPGTSWLRILPPGSTEPTITIDRSEITIEVELPERLDAPRSATLVVEGNGGCARLPIKLIPEVRSDTWTDPRGTPVTSWSISTSIERLSPRMRLAASTTMGVVLRLLLGAMDRILASTGETPHLLGAVVLLAGGGLLAGTFVAIRRNRARDLVTSAFAGGILGAMSAAVLVATGRFVEPLSGGWMLLSALLWGGLAASAAAISLWQWPHRSKSEVR